MLVFGNIGNQCTIMYDFPSWSNAYSLTYWYILWQNQLYRTPRIRKFEIKPMNFWACAHLYICMIWIGSLNIDGRNDLPCMTKHRQWTVFCQSSVSVIAIPALGSVQSKKNKPKLAMHRLYEYYICSWRVSFGFICIDIIYYIRTSVPAEGI